MTKNKKTLLILGAISLLIIVAGVSYTKIKSGKLGGNSSTSDSKGIFTSVKDALSKNLTLVCDFKDESGTSVKSYIKNGAVRVSTVGSTEAQSGDIIIKDKKMYMWDVKTKTGFVYDIPDSESSENKTSGLGGTEVVKSDAYLNMIDKYKDSCKVSAVEDSYFVAPADVKFQDMSKFLEDLKKQMPQDNQ